MNWRQCTLGELIRIKHGWAFKGQFFSDSGKYIVLTPGNFHEKGGFRTRPGKDRAYSSDFPEAYLLKEGDVIIAMTEQAPGLLGSSALIPESDKYLHNQRLGLVQPIDESKVDIKFIYHLFNTANVRGQISGSASGTKVRHTAPERVGRVTVRIPDISSQRKIAETISAYDDLIENNRRRIDLLEQSARMLYKEWFVSLRFPGHEHVKVKDGVPQGWERVSLSKVAEVNRESLRSNFQGDIEYIDIASVSTGTIEETTLYSFEDAPGRARRVVKHGDIIWSCVRPNRKSYSVIWNPAENLIASTGFAVLSPTDVPTSFLLQATTTDDFVGYLSNNARGAAYPAVTGTDFEKATILVSTKMLLQQYNDFAEPLLSQIYTLQQHNRKMKQARDLFLPRLMNGEIPV